VNEFWSECPAFAENPVVRDALAAGYTAEQILPVSLYWDGVKFTKNESFVGFYCDDMLSRRKFLVAALRRDLKLHASIATARYASHQL
jgi:hypothetical protein